MRGISRGGTIPHAAAARRRVAWLARVLGSLVVGLAGPALGAPTLAVSSASFGNVFVAGESPVLEITVTADAEGIRGRLRVVAVDAYGKSAGRMVARVDLAPGAAVARQFSIRTRRLGHFTVRAELFDAGRRSVAEAVTTAGIVPPIDASDAEESGIGYFVVREDSELPRANEIAAEMRRFGIRWVRLFATWSDQRRVRPDVSDPAWLDSAAFESWVAAFRANGIEVLGVLFGTARWASSTPDAVGGIGASPLWALVVPSDLADWELFVRTLAERLRGRVRSWEVWNEPDIDLFWLSTAADFVALTRATAGVLHALDPDARVVVNLVFRRAFYEAVVAGAADVLDVFGLHYGEEGSAVSVVREATPLLRPRGVIWNTEAFGAPRRHITWWLSQRADGVQRIFPFIYHVLADDGGDPLFERFGTPIVNSDYTPRVDAIALRTLSDLVGSATPVAGKTVGLGYIAYTYASSAGSVVALADGSDGLTWSIDRAVRLWLQVPREVRRVTVVDLMGNRQVRRVRKGRLRITLRGAAAFLLAKPEGSLTDLDVIRSRLAQ